MHTRSLIESTWRMNVDTCRMSFSKNGFSCTEIKRTFARFDSKKQKAQREREEVPIWGTAVVPFYQTVTNRLTRLLHHKNIRTTSYPFSKKLKQQLHPLKDLLGLRVPGVYKVPCGCGANYIGQTGWLVSIRIIEHKHHARLGQTEKSAIAQHC